MTSGSMDGDPRLRRGSQSSVRDGIAMVIGAIVVAGALLLGGQAPASTAPEGPTATAPAAVVTTGTVAALLAAADASGSTNVESLDRVAPVATDPPEQDDRDPVTAQVFETSVQDPVVFAIQIVGGLLAIGRDAQLAGAATDTDGDGVPDTVERRLGTNPNRRDSDRDGTPDGKEDPDKDRLRTLFELDRSETDPGDPDSDNDGIRDSVEDSDGDKLSNAAEQRYGLNPRRKDTNGDGQSDWREDHDRDGRSNGLEQDNFNLPSNLTPTLGDAGRDIPRSGSERCHQRRGLTKPVSCSWGDPDGKLVLIFGDSHAVQWFPAIYKVAKLRGWHLMSMTKSACPLPDITTIRDGAVDTSCVTWRKKALAKIARLNPDLVIATSLDVYPRFIGDGGNASSASSEAKWGAGLVRTLKKLRASAAKVVFLGDSHDWGGGALDCLARHRTNVSACVVRADSKVQVRREKTARKAAETAHVAYHSTRKLTCPYDPCPLVVDRYLVTRDGGTHLSATYAKILWRGIERRLPDI